MKRYAYPTIGDKRIGTITLVDVEAILRPIWSRKTETAARLRSRIEAVIDYGYIAEGIDRRNPDVFKGNLEHRGFGKRRKISPVVNHPAAPYFRIPAIMEELRQINTTTALCLRFIILTWTRSSEARGARWEEFNERERLWSIPAERMKAHKQHDVPMSEQAHEIIATMRKRTTGVGLVFPGASAGVLSDVGLNKVLHHLPTVCALDAEAGRKVLAATRRKPRGATVHGMRSSARSWAAAQTEFPPFVAELALEQTQLQLNLGDSRFMRLVIPFVSAGQEAGRHDTSPVDGSA